MRRSIARLGLCVSLVTLAAACQQDVSSTTEGGGGDGAGATTTAQGGASTTTSEGGAGGTSTTTTGGGGAGGSTTTTGGGGAGGRMTGGGGAGGSGMAELCGNGEDDDGDGDTDCDDADCTSVPVCGALVINEVDYDNPSTDTAELIELWNAGASATDLTGLSVVLVDGADNGVYTEIPLSGTLAAGQYLVIASPGVTGIAPGAIVVPMPAAQSNVENGGSSGQGDAIAIYDAGAKVVLDSISYEGAITMAVIDGGVFNLVSGTPTPAADDSHPSKSIIRFPNGQDTGNDAADWTATLSVTPGKANEAAEVCDDALDNDGDGLVDCADISCNDAPECPEICTNGADDDGDGLVDCADMVCDGKACGMFGLVCSGMTCACPGGAVETTCSGGADEDCDGMTDCADPDCAMAAACLTAAVSSVDYPVVTHGGKLVVSGVGFTGSTMVTIGGVSVAFTVGSDTQITLGVLPETIPLGAQPLVVTTPAGATVPFLVTVIHLLINELDSDQPGTDTMEFVEISTGVPNVSLAGYTLVMWNGDGNTSYLSLALSGTTDANGLLLAGNVGVVPPPSPMCTWMNSTLQNGQDAISVHQAPPASFPNGTTVTAANLIDALVYDTNDPDDEGLLNALIGPAGTVGRVQVDEDAGGLGQTQSIQRCGDGRLRGDKFAAGAPTPGAVNTVPACP